MADETVLDTIRTLSPDVFNTLAQRCEISKCAIYSILDSIIFKYIFYEVNIRSSYWDIESHRLCVERAAIVKISEEEGHFLTDCWLVEASDLSFAQSVGKAFPNLKLFVYTMGAKGSIVYDFENGPKEYIGHSFIMRIYWDNEEFPSVEALISAFFGSAYDENFENIEGEYSVLNSAMVLVAPGRGYNSYFEMPFRKHCRITMENRCDQNEGLYYMISGWHGKIPEDAGYFHTVYRQEHPVQKGRSYTVIDGIRGKGTFIGVTLASGRNGNNTCWVEGEAKIYIDGDVYPTLNYTGTEDYFCGSYAFGNNIILGRYQTYSGLYIGVYAILGNDRTKQYNGQQRFLLYRWHIPDPVYFDESFRMTMDNLGWTGPRYDDYTTVAYYYLEKPSKLPYVLPADHEMIMK